ncbi:hypothetical protein CONPUDRAFT_76413 [Coniophora puteana RWD-64-598 SS2]|uniref:Uncharacterized protein n=1 Tax=Coniophora puteana (strain RWD-64-598) TaxID=741705 RepID=A0A5M3MCB7_CONPW|nr:uncharacterized protein CONPUDRAFT_76413 [Coniophora puteana RWD-64-598 SS2]EIW76848.1 hypothetical protein CONPUDRAFT_76413 [Coniophora puteana RWD-64-598 SS2]
MPPQAHAGQSLRISIAVAALASKPPELSVASHILALRDKFPLDNCSQQEASSSTSDDWKSRALALEREISQLKRRGHEGTISAPPALRSWSPKLSSSSQKEDTRWVTQHAPSPEDIVKNLLEKLKERYAEDTTSTSPSQLLSSFDLLRQALANDAPDAALFNRITLQVVAELSPFVQDLVSPGSPLFADAETLQVVSVLLMHVLCAAGIVAEKIGPSGNLDDNNQVEANDPLRTLVSTVFQRETNTILPEQLSYYFLTIYRISTAVSGLAQCLPPHIG